MVKKNIILVSALALLIVGVSGCNAGDDSTSSTNQSISAEVTSGSCTNMQAGDTCEITITYNTNGESGLQLGFSPTSLPDSINNSTFYTTFGDCGSTVGGSDSEYTCQQPVVIEYVGSCTSNCGSPSGSQTTNIDLSFTLGDATSDSINITGD